ncbi:unnamed protein product [Rhizoctonia solani]|uniref:Uncharacterized protein n=1 Tax=Rhizoctonia solani TaxID=456999 RepID=A0A8H3GGR7_9AGAM|nr:unnamed protein product [Rhizoctonia solani]
MLEPSPEGEPEALLNAPPPVLNPNAEDDESSTHNNNLNLDTRSAHNHPPTSKEAHYACNQVDAATQTCRQSGGFIYADLDPTTWRWFTAIETCLNHFIQAGSKNFLAASIHAAEGLNAGAVYARTICQWIQALIDTGDLPYYNHGWWNVSALEDEDIVHKIKAHLEKIGKLTGPKAIVEFLEDPETCICLGVPNSISLQTAQRWMQCCGGFCWCKNPKGQYLDGHKQANVVDY